MKRSTVLLAASLVLLPASARAEGLNVSRLIYRVTIDGWGLVSRSVPQAALIPYCGDADGCELSLKIENGYGIEVKHTHLHLSEIDPLLWLSEASPVAGAHRDADGNTEEVFSVWSGLASCGVGDYEIGGADESAGLTLGLVGTVGAVYTCVLVVED